MTRRLLDTNTVSDLIRNPGGGAARRIAVIGQGAVCTSVIVAAELRYGAIRRGSPILSLRVSEALERLEVLPFDTPADEAYAAIRTQLERSGRPISANDMFIAAHALSLGFILVTDNLREFARVEGLVCENWLR